MTFRCNETARFALIASAFVTVTSAQALHAEPSVKSRAVSVSPARTVPLSAFEQAGKWIESGIRVESSTKGVLVASRSFPEGGAPQGIELPLRLGGGALFFQPSGVDGSTATHLFRAKSWTSELVPIAQVPYGVHHIVAGFDKIYLIGTTITTAFDLDAKTASTLAPLPPLVTLEGLAFDGPERALVKSPLGGVLYTEDSGLTFSPVPSADEVLIATPGNGLYVSVEGESLQVQGGGRLARPSSLPPLNRWESFTSDAHRLKEEQRPPGKNRSSFQRSDYEAVVTQGATFGAHLAVAIEGGRLLALNLASTLQLSAEDVLVDPASSCLALESNTTSAEVQFVCQGEHTEVFSLAVPRRPTSEAASILEGNPLRSVVRWEYPRRLLGRSAGSALFSGSCSRETKITPQTPSQLCLMRDGRLTTLENPTLTSSLKKAFRSGVSHAFALGPQDAWILWLNSREATLRAKRIWSQKKRTTPSERSWKLPEGSSLQELFESGSILPHATRRSDGFSLWLSDRDQFAGVFLGDDEKPSFSAIQRPTSRALFDGPRVLLWGAAGFAKKSEDHGRTFQEISLPYQSGDGAPSFVESSAQAVTMGCSSVGCIIGAWARIGWAKPSQAEVSPGPRLKMPEFGPGRFTFQCYAGPFRSAPRAVDERDGVPLFWEAPPPSAQPSHHQISLGFPDHLAHLYAWGPDGNAWSRESKVQLYFVSPFDPEKIRRTAPTGQLFASFADTELAFGALDLSTAFPLIAFDPEGDKGVLLLKTKNSTHLLLFAEGKPLRVIQDVSDRELRNLLSAVEVDGRFFASFQKGDRLEILRLDTGEVKEIASLPLGESGLRSAHLVRGSAGNLGLSIEGDTGLIVYPLSYEGELGTPLSVPHQSSRPETCAPEAQGFIVDRGFDISPYLSAADDTPIAVSQVQARWIVGYGKPCLESLRGRVRSEPALSRAPEAKKSLPLSLFNSDSQGRRSVLLCE